MKILLLAGSPILLADLGKSVDSLLAEFINTKAKKETVGKWLKEPKPTVFQYSQLESNQQFTLRRETMRFFCRVAEWYKIACNHRDFGGYGRFVYFLILAEMV